MHTGFEDYVRTRGDSLHRFAYLICGDRHLGEDLVQEVLVGDLSRLGSARLHGRVAQALEQQGRSGTGRDGDALDERLAHHFVEAVPVLGLDRADEWMIGPVAREQFGLALGKLGLPRSKA